MSSSSPYQYRNTVCLMWNALLPYAVTTLIQITLSCQNENLFVTLQRVSNGQVSHCLVKTKCQHIQPGQCNNADLDYVIATHNTFIINVSFLPSSVIFFFVSFVLNAGSLSSFCFFALLMSTENAETQGATLRTTNNCCDFYTPSIIGLIKCKKNLIQPQ